MDFIDYRKDFPALSQSVNGKPLVYFDNAATSLKPQIVIDAVSDFYASINSNVHRAGHFLSIKATEAYENARKNISTFINADDPNEIIFTKGTTESINLLADILRQSLLKEGDEVILTRMEHHSNIVPWVSLKENLGIAIKTIDVDDSGELILDELENLFTSNTKVISISHSSNVLGTINPIKKIIEFAKSKGVITIVDGAQAIVHDKVDVQDLDCDFYCFSGHKFYAPMGVGVLYGKKDKLHQLMPYQRGGGMIDKVSFEHITYNISPYKFEAGTPNVGGAVGLSTAVDYVNKVGIENIVKYEQSLLKYATNEMQKIDDLVIHGTAINKDPIISFSIKGVHHYDLGMILDQFGIAIRTGHHCTQPLMERFKLNGAARISFAFYNTKEEIDYFVDKLKVAATMLV